jgi:hypothetical protein
VADLSSLQCGLHQAGVTAGNVEKAERRLEKVVERVSKDCPDLAMCQATAFDQFAVRTPLFLELGKRGCIHHGAVGSKLMNVNVDQGRTSSQG